MAPNFEDNNFVYDFVVKQGHGVKGLVDSGISEIPEIFIHAQEERIDKLPSPNSHHKQLLEPIDLSQLDGPNHENVVKAIVKAAEKLGFFQIINHGVPVGLLESLIKATRIFFAQPTERKAVYLNGVSPCPRVKYGTSFIPDKEATLKWRDFFRMVYSGDAEAHDFWPKEFKEEALEYLKSCTKVVRRLLKMMFTNLGVTTDNSRLESLAEYKSVVMNYYPPCPNPELAVAVGSHSDVSILTVLLQDGVGGLQVKVEEDANDPDNKEEWIEIPPVPGALVINVGDVWQILSNGRFRSAKHRVRTCEESRVSIPFFALPRLKENIGPLAQLVERDRLARYREVIYEDYLNNSTARAQIGRKPIDFAKINSA